MHVVYQNIRNDIPAGQLIPASFSVLNRRRLNRRINIDSKKWLNYEKGTLDIIASSELLNSEKTITFEQLKSQTL